ncbi:MAG TPA: PDZ domain-containing protein [Vicinamibacterales bacterium]
MNLLRISGFAAALVVAAGAGAAFAPVAHGQSATAPRARAVQVFSGSGSQIGVSVRDIEAADKATQGVVVEDVIADGPAATAGVKKGDVVVEFDGERVRSVQQFRRLVSETPDGRKVSAVVMRDGQRVTLSVQPKAGEGLRVFGNFGRDFDYAFPVPPAPPSPPTPPSPPVPPVPDFERFIWRVGNTLGVMVQELSSQLSDYFGVKDGVLVVSVEEQSPAGKAGLKAGDVITSINGTAIGSGSDLRRQVQKLKSGDDFTAEVTRDHKPVTLKGKMEERRNRSTTFRTVL